MLSTIAVSRAAQQAAGRIEKEAVGGFVLSSNMQGSMLTPRGGGMVRPADVRRIAQLPGVDSYMVRQNATADLVGANVAKVPGGDDYDATQEQQFGNAANVMGTNDSSKLNVFTSRTLGMAEGRHLKASDKYTSMIHEDLAKANGLKVGDTLTLKANAYDADNESHSTATVKTTIVGIFKGDSARKVSSRAELTANTIYTDLDTTRDLYQYKDGKEIYQDATFCQRAEISRAERGLGGLADQGMGGCRRYRPDGAVGADRYGADGDGGLFRLATDDLGDQGGKGDRLGE